MSSEPLRKRSVLDMDREISRLRRIGEMYKAENDKLRTVLGEKEKWEEITKQLLETGSLKLKLKATEAVLEAAKLYIKEKIPPNSKDIDGDRVASAWHEMLAALSKLAEECRGRTMAGDMN